MIKKILIANRGEIALRVVKTCRKLGIKTVTIFADNDQFLPHANAGDESVSLGGGSLAQTYLNQRKIIDLAKKYNVDAIHPGYGFLSENSSFQQNIAKAGMIFIGPCAEAIELMGDKKESKVKMEQIGVPLVPGYHGENQDEKFLLDEAKKIGFPVLIKATAGGGGKGMRIVQEEAEFLGALEASKREASNAFGNDKVLLEKYIELPRHIEVQLVSDGKGNHYHFFERECSIQRRYQKVIEETPSPIIDDELREKICSTAVKIAEGINYLGAGTIEYILTPQKDFYFLEMNTRLQVEHPVTEEVTGFDLVELQIRAANGEAFGFKQEDIKQKGHSIECRIYAEDPDNNFLPTNGRVKKISAQHYTDYRLDSGYTDGNSISTSYDPMLAKLIVHADSRENSIKKMNHALDDVLFLGAKTNRDYLKRILSHKEFVTGNIHTHFVETYKKQLDQSTYTDQTRAIIIAAALFSKTIKEKSIWNVITKKLSKEIFIDEKSFCFDLLEQSHNKITFAHRGNEYTFFLRDFEGEYYSFEGMGDFYYAFQSYINQDEAQQIIVNSLEAKVKLVAKAQKTSMASLLGEGALQSPMPGKVFKILKKEGESVQEGEDVLIVEAMKMEHSIKATASGTVKNIFFKEGEQVQGGVLLCEIE